MINLKELKEKIFLKRKSQDESVEFLSRIQPIFAPFTIQILKDKVVVKDGKSYLRVNHDKQKDLLISVGNIPGEIEIFSKNGHS